MPEISVEEAVSQNCQALLSGDLMRVMNDFTPEALGAVVASASGITNVPTLLGYSIRSHETSGDDHVFSIAFQTSDGEVGASATWREVEGFWKITSLTIEGL